MLLVASFSFDAAVIDLYGALLNGAALYPVSLKEQGFAQLASILRRERITVYHSTPTVYRYFLSSLGPQEPVSQSVRLVVLGGEEVTRRDVELYRTHFSDSCIFVNGLGPTESTLALQYFIDKATPVRGVTVPVGYPVTETEVLLLDDTGQPTPVCGEIVIRSPYVALGYWQRPELTEQAFSGPPGVGESRTYRTGDLGRRLPDGSLEFLGRRDLQVKVRGYRIETAEVESELLKLPGVNEAVVVSRPDPRGENHLVAYLLLAKSRESALPIEEIRESLRDHLPDHMVPAVFVLLDALPMTGSGKVDRQALPAPELQCGDAASKGVAPRNELEKAITAIWCDVLGYPQVGVNTNFFDVGGHSLLLIQVQAKVQSLADKPVAMLDLFRFPTVEGLAKLLSGHRAVDESFEHVRARAKKAEMAANQRRALRKR